MRILEFCFSDYEEFCEDFYLYYIEYIAFCRKVIFIILILPVHDYGSSFHFLVHSQSLSSEIYNFNCRGLSPC